MGKGEPDRLPLFFRHVRSEHPHFFLLLSLHVFSNSLRLRSLRLRATVLRSGQALTK